MKTFFKKNLLSFAKWIIEKFDSPTFKNIEILERFTVQKLNRNFLLSGDRLTFSIIPHVLLHEAREKCFLDLFNDLVESGAIKIEESEDVRNGDRHYSAQIRVLFPKK